MPPRKSDGSTDSTVTPQKILISVPRDVADTIDAIGVNIDAAQEELAREVHRRLGVSPPVRSLTRPQIVEIAVGELLKAQDAAADAASDDHSPSGTESAGE